MNVLYLLADQHNPEYTGCHGHPLVRTPSIDGLAARGTRFESAYALSPICSSTRAAMMCGRYVHEIGVWDNAFAWSGLPRGWSHRLADAGVHLATIGKLDFEPDCAHGIAETMLAMHRENIDITSLYREQDILVRYDLLAKHRATGPADSLAAYASDASVAETAVEWLHDRAPRITRPWVLRVSFNDLHRPWNPPRERWEHHEALVRAHELDERFSEPLGDLHPFHQTFARHHCAEHMTLEDARRAVIGYLGSVEVLDHHLGVVLRGLESAGLVDDTLVVYASDHGGMVGEHRCYDHGALYEGSVRIPLVFAGPDIAAGRVDPTVVSAIDIAPTIAEALGVERPASVRGRSVYRRLTRGPRAAGAGFALCEYHGAGSRHGAFMLREGRYKLIECVGDRPMLFDLEDDPHEMHDLAAGAGALDTRALARLRETLAGLCSPDDVDRRARADQRRRRAELAADGRLFAGLRRRGYVEDAHRLAHRTEYVAAQLDRA